MDSVKKYNTAIAVFIFVGLVVFFHLGSGEVQPWDEGLYAIRAKSILDFGAFFDQTQYSPGGLYSSTYPPLSVWLISLSMKIFGPTAFSLRLFSALCSITTVFLVFLILKRMVSYELSLLAALLQAGTLTWNTYSRQGMTDVPLIMFITLAFFAVIKIHEKLSVKAAFLWLIVFFLSFAAALMTKIVLSIIPLLFVILFCFEKNKKQQSVWLTIASVLSILAALPWHIMMISKYGNIFFSAFSTPHLYSSVENNTSRIGILYYLNQMLISNPFFLFSFVTAGIIIVKWKKINGILENNNKFILKVIIVWFVSAFVIFSIAPTKLPHYLLILVPPGMILASIFYQNFHKLELPDRAKWFILSGLILSALWSFGVDMRNELRLIGRNQELSYTLIVYLALIIFSVAFGVLTKKETLIKFTQPTFPKISYLILIFIILRLVFLNAFFPPGTVFGGAKSALQLQSLNINSFVYLYHEHNSSDTLNPQLAWYLDGWMNGRLKGKSYVPIKMPERIPDFISMRVIDKYPNQIVVYYLPQDVYLAKTVFRDIRETRPVISLSKNYIIFGRKVKLRDKGMVI